MKTPSLAILQENGRDVALCKWRGALVIVEVSHRTDGTPGHCPQCYAVAFTERHGWTECDCGFAYLTADLQRIAEARVLRGEG